ncbi:MAG: hypothetical protein ACRC57_10495 [Sarcina sp.]
MYRIITDTRLVNSFINNNKSPLKKGYLLIKGNYFYFSTNPIPNSLLELSEKDLKEYIKKTYTKSAVNFSINKCNLKLKTNTNTEYNFYDVAFGSKKFLMLHDYERKKDSSFKNINFNSITPVLLNYNSKPLNFAINFSYLIITIIYGIFIFKLLFTHTLIAYLLIIFWGISCIITGKYILKVISKNIQNSLE